METYRLFIALPLPPAVKAALTSAQARLRRGGAPIKWVSPETIHLTLRFLGETNPALLPSIGAAMQQSCQGQGALQLSLTHMSAFPNTRRPNVVWAGVGGAVAALGRLAANLARALAALGFPNEARPFRAHLTLGRARHRADPAAIERLGDTLRALPQLPPIAWVAERVTLFHSELRPSGPIYTELDAVQF